MHGHDQQVEFPLDEPLSLPQELTDHRFGDRTLFIAPEKASWLTVTRTGADLLACLRRGKTLRASLEETVASGRASYPEAVLELQSLLRQITLKEFYQDYTFADPGAADLNLHLHLTQQCNLRCRHCYMDSGVSSSGELDLAAWQGVVDQFAKLGGTSITYSGGEPLLFPQFHALAAHGQEQGLRTDLITNGMLIRSRADAAAVAAVVDMVRISVDGATAEGHERIRGKGTFPRVNRALEMLAEEDVRLEVAVTLFPNNVEDVVTNVESYLTSLLERGVRPAKVAFSRGMEEGRATGSLDVLDFEVIYRDIKRRLDGELWDLEHPRPPLKFADCGYGDSLTLSATGEVYPCGLLYRSGGNVRREPLGVIYDRFRKEQKQLTVDRLPVCRECDVRYICGGGCRLRNLKVNGNLGRTACSAAWREEYYRLLMGRDEVFLRLGQRALEQRSIDRMEKSRNEQRKELRNDREAAA